VNDSILSIIQLAWLSVVHGCEIGWNFFEKNSQVWDLREIRTLSWSSIFVFCLLVFFFSLTSRVLCAERQHENSGHKNTSWSAWRIPRASNSTIPPATLRSSFQPGDTSKAQFSSRFFLLVRDEDAPYIYFAGVPVEDQHRHFQRQLGANRDFGPLDARVFRGVFPPSLPLSPSPAPPWPPHKRITWVPKRAKRGSMARGR